MSDRTGAGTVQWSGRLPATLPRRLKTAAAIRGQTIGDYVESLVAADERRWSGAVHPFDRAVDERDRRSGAVR